MEYQLEREIRLKKSKDKVLYSWYLQECGSDGTPNGAELIPWEWTLYFTVSELRYYKSIDIEKSNSPEDVIEENKTVKESDFIMAIMHPGTCDDGNWLKNDTVFSMYGTDREIKKFTLRISKLDDEDAVEFCKVWGCIRHTIEDVDGDETIDDTIQVNMYISSQRFNNIADIIKTQVPDIVQVSLGKVSGFYSEWSPSIHTDSVKILTSYHPKIEFNEDSGIIPPRLCEVGEFNITIVLRHKLNPKQDLRIVDIHKHFMDDEPIQIEQNKKEAVQKPSTVIPATSEDVYIAQDALKSAMWNIIEGIYLPLKILIGIVATILVILILSSLNISLEDIISLLRK